MRSVLRAAPGALLVGLLLAGCGGNNADVYEYPGKKPDKPPEATVKIKVPGMT